PAHAGHAEPVHRRHRDGPRGGERLPRDSLDGARRTRRADPDRPDEVRGPNARDAGSLAPAALGPPGPRERTPRALAETGGGGRLPSEDAPRCAREWRRDLGPLAGVSARHPPRGGPRRRHGDRLGIRPVSARPPAPPDDRRIARGERLRGDLARPARGLRIPGGHVAHGRVHKGRLRDAGPRPDPEPAERGSHDPSLIDAPGTDQYLPIKQAPRTAATDL